MEEQIKFIKDYLNGCKAIFNGKNLEDTDKALTRLAEIETELKQLRVADVIKNKEIKTLADGYYAGNADWFNKEQEQDTKVGWRQGFAYALRQFAVSGSLSFDEGYEKGYNDATK
jgi:hypothetical protein